MSGTKSKRYSKLDLSDVMAPPPVKTKKAIDIISVDPKAGSPVTQTSSIMSSFNAFKKAQVALRPHKAGSGSLPTPNAQQQAVINCKAKVIRVHALAGTGKSTTVLHILKNNPNVPTLYVVFNSLLRTEMEERIADARLQAKVTVNTIHSYAYHWMSNKFFGGMGVPLAHNRVQFTEGLGVVEGDCSNMKAIAQKLNLEGPHIGACQTWESTESYLNNVYRTLKNFFQSKDELPTDKHIAVPRYGLGGTTPLNSYIALDASNIYMSMMLKPADFVWDFEAMIRCLYLDKTPWPFEKIILDEAQDSSFWFAQKMRSQTHAQRIFLGDPHQSIYQFRNAHDATQPAPPDPRAPNLPQNDTVLTLTETHRFGPEIAKLANTLLEIKGSSDRLIGRGKDSDIDYINVNDIPNPDKTTYIAATNNQLLDVAFKRFLEGKNYIITGDKEVTIQDALDLLALKRGFLSSVKSPVLKRFKNYEDLEGYVEESGNDDFAVPMEWVKNPQTVHALPQLKHEILKRFTKDVTKIDLGNMCVLSTAHQLSLIHI